MSASTTWELWRACAKRLVLRRGCPRVAQRDHSEEPKSTGIDLFLPESNVLHALTWMQNCAAGQTRAHSAERRSRLQCMTSLSSSVPRAFSPQPRWLFLADPPPIRRAPTG